MEVVICDGIGGFFFLWYMVEWRFWGIIKRFIKVYYVVFFLFVYWCDGGCYCFYVVGFDVLESFNVVRFGESEWFLGCDFIVDELLIYLIMMESVYGVGVYFEVGE